MRYSSVFLSLSVILFATACRPANDGPQPLPKNERDKQAAPDKQDPRPEFSLGAELFSQEFKKDKDPAGQKYAGKVVELTGTVLLVGLHISSSPFIALQGADPSAFVQCFTTEPEPWHKALPGAKVKLRGKCHPGGQLESTEIVEVTSVSIPEFTADQLAAEFTADRTAAAKKHAGKYLIASGEIADRRVTDVGTVHFVLNTTGKTKVVCGFALPESKLVESLKLGQRVRVVGECSIFAGEEDEIRVYACLPLKQR